jgi:hypothetical protein
VTVTCHMPNTGPKLTVGVGSWPQQAGLQSVVGVDN